MHATSSLKNSETWTPICFPNFNENGFLHAYISFIAPEICLILIASKQESFYDISNCRNIIYEVRIYNNFIVIFISF